jgi:hypothetical protein
VLIILSIMGLLKVHVTLRCLANTSRWFEGLYCLELPSLQSISLVQLLDPEEEGATIPGNVGNFFFQSTRHNIPEDSVL